MRAKPWDVKDFKRVLKVNGFEKKRKTGSHEIWKKDGETIVITTKNLDKLIANNIIKTHNLIT